MRKNIITTFLISIIILSGYYFLTREPISGAPPYGESKEDVPTGELDWLKNWVRPDGPPKVGLQVGHWKNDELPEELEKLIGNTGSSGGGKSEWEVNFAIAIATKEILEENGVVVDIIPATVPKQYWADVFLAIHADGNLDSSVRGYKIASPWRDLTNSSDELVEFIDETYSLSTSLPKDPNISRNMRGYYAFSWWRFDHAIHPMTTAAIVETGFLTNYSDRQLLINKPDVSARGIATGILNYLDSKSLLISKSSN